MKSLSFVLLVPVLVVVCGAGALAQDLKQVGYADGPQKLNGLVTDNAGAGAGARFPGVLVLPAWKGIDQEARTTALELEKQGYIAFVADIYGEGNIPADNAAAGKAAGSYRANFQAYQHRIELALEQSAALGRSLVVYIDGEVKKVPAKDLLPEVSGKG